MEGGSNFMSPRMVEETKEGGDFMSSLKNGYEMTCVQVEEIGNNCQVQMGNIADCDATVLTNMIPSCDGSFLPDCSDTCETVQGEALYLISISMSSFPHSSNKHAKIIYINERILYLAIRM